MKSQTPKVNICASSNGIDFCFSIALNGLNCLESSIASPLHFIGAGNLSFRFVHAEERASDAWKAARIR